MRDQFMHMAGRDGQSLTPLFPARLGARGEHNRMGRRG